jgi:uncharacterized protein YlzI (FlbEa/FlbD family)
MASVQLLRGYNQKHSKKWDENLIYIQHSYNKEIHTSTSKPPFAICFECFPPSPLDVVYGKKGVVREDIIGEALKVDKCVDKIRHIHLQLHVTLNKSQEIYRAIHD